MFAIADCNNFYASCERVFRPHLDGKPISTDAILETIALEDIWGISRRWPEKLQASGIKNALSLSYAAHPALH
jgi:nucleotidyltransferase/DNA polymerase involved in DNA repair